MPRGEIRKWKKKYHDIVQKYQGTYEILAKYKLPNYLSGYEGWEECVNEHLVRAMTIYTQKMSIYWIGRSVIE